MARSLLSLMLAAAHLVSASAAPLYLCISHDGSLCIDAGPDDCDCCHEPAAAPHPHGACAYPDAWVAGNDDHQRASALARAADSAAAGCSLAAEDPCQCEHLAISGSGSPAIVRTSSGGDAGKFIAVAVTHAGALPPAPPTIFGQRAELFEQPSSTLFLSTVLRSVVLRC